MKNKLNNLIEQREMANEVFKTDAIEFISTFLEANGCTFDLSNYNDGKFVALQMLSYDDNAPSLTKPYLVAKNYDDDADYAYVEVDDLSCGFLEDLINHIDLYGM